MTGVGGSCLIVTGNPEFFVRCSLKLPISPVGQGNTKQPNEKHPAPNPEVAIEKRENRPDNEGNKRDIDEQEDSPERLLYFRWHSLTDPDRSMSSVRLLVELGSLRNQVFTITDVELRFVWLFIAFFVEDHSLRYGSTFKKPASSATYR